jgi:hypothetical protein
MLITKSKKNKKNLKKLLLDADLHQFTRFFGLKRAYFPDIGSREWSGRAG